MDRISEDASIAFLRPSTIERLSVQLNQEKFILSEDGLLRDWRGVYELTSINDRHINELIRGSSDPFKQLLDHWKHFPDASIKRLFEILERMDRFDVIDDNLERIAQDIQYADSLLQQRGFSVTMIENEIAGSEKVLTYDDIASLKRKQTLVRYDVLILHAEEDHVFASTIAENLEKQNISVCLKDRDLVVGTVELQAVTKLISDRCNKVAVLLSPNFFGSNENSFYSTLAQTYAIQNGSRSFLPIIYQPVSLPSNIDSLTKLRAGNNPYFWSKLCRNVKEDWVEDRVNNPLPPPFKEVVDNQLVFDLSRASAPLAAHSEPRHRTSAAAAPAKPAQKSEAVFRPSSQQSEASRRPQLKASSKPKRETTTAASDKPKTGGGLFGKLFKMRKSRSTQEFSNMMYDDTPDGSMIRLIDKAPGVPDTEPGRSPNPAKSKLHGSKLKLFS